jgi:hypothetical protein
VPRLRAVPRSQEPRPDRPRLAELLVRRGIITSEQMQAALARQRIRELPLGEILLAEGAITEAQLLDALAWQYQTTVLPADSAPPDPEPGIAALMPAQQAARLSAVPLRRAGVALVVMTDRPDRKAEIAAAQAHDGPVLLALAGRALMQQAITATYGTELARLAEARTPGSYSCRDWNAPLATRRGLAALLALVGAALLAPALVVAVLFGMGVLIAAVNAALKWMALHSLSRPAPEGRDDLPQPLPGAARGHDHAAAFSRTRYRGPPRAPDRAARLPP